jgi:hypothetical protein
MKTITTLCFLVVLSFSTALGQASTSNVAVVDNPNAPVITFEESVHDYGTIEQGSDGTCYFQFTNSGKEPLILQKPRSSCGCTVPTWPKTPILGGEGDKIKVTYNTRKIGSFNKTVTVTSNAKNKTVVLRITGKVVAKKDENVGQKDAGEGTPVNQK